MEDTVICLFCVEIFSAAQKSLNIFHQKFNSTKKLKNVEDGQQLHSPSFSSLAAVRNFLSTC